MNRARQFFRELLSFEGRKAQLDKLKQKLPCARCGQLGHWKDDYDCPAKVKAVDWRKPESFQFSPSRATSLSSEREQGATTSTLSDGQGAFARALGEGVCITPGTQAECSSKLVGELCTVSCVSGDSNSVELPQIFLCESNESLLHIFGPENFTCVADVCSYVPNLDDSVVSDCGNTQLRTGDTGTARCAPGSVLGVGDTEQTFSCQPDRVVPGTQPVCESLSSSAPKVDSEYCVDVCIYIADVRSCMVSCANGFSMVGDSAVWTCMTNDSWTDGGLPICEPQVCADLSLGSSAASDCDWTLYSHTWTVSCASGYAASDMDDADFKCLAPPGIPDGLLPRCVPLLCPGQNSKAWRVSRTLATVLVSGIIAEQNVPMVWLKFTRLCRTTAPCLRPTSKCQSRLRRSRFAGRMHCKLRRELRGQV